MEAQRVFGVVLVVVFFPRGIFDLIAADRGDFFRDDVQNPVRKMSAPVVDGSAGDFAVGAPPSTLLTIAVKSGLDAENAADDLLFED